jgi:hypothetical protein
MDASNYTLFDISLQSFNLLSFMLGMTFAFFKQGLFGKRIGIWVITYFICLAGFYGVKAAMVIENANQPFIEVPR